MQDVELRCWQKVHQKKNIKNKIKIHTVQLKIQVCLHTSALSSGTQQRQMCPAVPPQDTKAIYLPEMTACVWVYTYHTHCFRNHSLSSKDVKMVVAPCSHFNSGGEPCNIENDYIPLGQCSHISTSLRWMCLLVSPTRDTWLPLSQKTWTAS